MACGLGAVALMFIFVKEATYSPLTESFKDEILPLEVQIENIDNLIKSKTDELTNVKKTIDNVNLEISSAKSKTDITNSVIDDLVKQNTNLTSALEELNNAWSQIAPKLYQSADQSPPGAPDTPEPSKKEKNKDEIEDADFEVVD